MMSPLVAEEEPRRSGRSSMVSSALTGVKDISHCSVVTLLMLTLTEI